MGDRPAAVVIGRDEGERLARCLASLRGRVAPLVYADSGSRDGSPQRAREAGARVVELDPARPFSAARGRNEGLACAVTACPEVELVQFVDGDCEIREGWIEAACAAFAADPGLAAVAGRLRERDPDRSLYHRLCDLEWDRPAGETDALGGIAMMRVRAVQAVGGYDEALVAGEDPELCLRLRRAGWRLWRLEAEMAWHHADLAGFGDWWRRSARGGRALALGALRHGGAPERYEVRRLLSTLGFGLGVPAATLALAAAAPAAALLPPALVAAQGLRIARGERRRGRGARDARLVAAFTLLGKVPGSLGALRELAAAVFGRGARGPIGRPRATSRGDGDS